ncbi:MAG TPA: protein phosphatase 2C domain-containing protein, partial [Verrucomicrobiae bacterium]|nr:protein phosphatase 2C domain-containing protein [Verrucomicrobiae bacterium]
LTFDGRVIKSYHGPNARERFANEVRVLRHLAARGCNFVPRLLEADEDSLRIITTNCGTRVEHLDAERTRELFAELENFSVRHDDPDMRNVTYRNSDGRFCVIDFEFATLLRHHTSKRRHAGISLKWSGWTDRGRVRIHNEDSFLGLQFDARESHHLGKIGQVSLDQMDCTFAVCDGMGGARAGEFASKIAVEKITSLLPRLLHRSAGAQEAAFSEALAGLFRQIHRALVYVGGSYEECAGMETTLSLCWFTPGKMFFGHVGDSRIYHLPMHGRKLKQLSHDDTHVGWLLRQGRIKEHEARIHPRRNVLQKALGGGNQFVDPQIGSVALKPGDLFLLCTDGLVEGLHDGHLAEHLRSPEFAGADSNLAHQLVETAVRNDGRDNVTALVVQAI